MQFINTLKHLPKTIAPYATSSCRWREGLTRLTLEGSVPWFPDGTLDVCEWHLFFRGLLMSDATNEGLGGSLGRADLSSPVGFTLSGLVLGVSEVTEEAAWPPLRVLEDSEMFLEYELVEGKDSLGTDEWPWDKFLESASILSCKPISFMFEDTGCWRQSCTEWTMDAEGISEGSFEFKLGGLDGVSGMSCSELVLLVVFFSFSWSLCFIVDSSLSALEGLWKFLFFLGICCSFEVASK